MTKRYTQRRRATAKNRASKRQPLAALRNPKPPVGTAPLAPRFTPSPPTTATPLAPPYVPDPIMDWDSEETPSVKKPHGCAYYFVGAGVLSALALAWWLI